VTAPGRDLIVVACAVSAGVHAALVPEHFAHGAAAGVSFAAAAVLLAAAAVAVSVRPKGPVFAGTAALLFGLIAAYVLATTTGLPVVQPEPEPVGSLAAGTKLIEGAGLVAALRHLRHEWAPAAVTGGRAH
jgi:hypothetical protein